MKFKKGDIVRIKNNGVRLSAGVSSPFMKDEQRKIRTVKHADDDEYVHVYSSDKNNDNDFFIWKSKSLELYDYAREQMLELESIL